MKILRIEHADKNVLYNRMNALKRAQELGLAPFRTVAAVEYHGVTDQDMASVGYDHAQLSMAHRSSWGLIAEELSEWFDSLLV